MKPETKVRLMVIGTAVTCSAMAIWYVYALFEPYILIWWWQTFQR